jgi:hypothetical protein
MERVDVYHQIQYSMTLQYALSRSPGTRSAGEENEHQLITEGTTTPL